MQILDLTNYQLATMAVALLGGESEFIDREDIAIKLDEIAPGRFSWRKYQDRIDLVVVVAALRDAKKTKNGKLLVGNNNRGWMLSPSGLKWIKNLNLIAPQNKKSNGYRKDSIYANLEMERDRLRSTKAYELFKNDDFQEICLHDFYRFARVNEYFQTKARQRRYAILDNAVAEDSTLSSLWNLLKEKFPEEMK
jgi:hypothetical protein